MKSISGMKDVDREILLKMNDLDFLKTCNLNKYFRYNVCDDDFFRRRLQQRYPDTVEDKGNESWRQYFLTIIYYVSKLKEDFNYEYVDGDPISIYVDLQREFIQPGFMKANLVNFLKNILDPEDKPLYDIASAYTILSRDIVTALLEIYAIENNLIIKEGKIIYFEINNVMSQYLNLPKNEKISYLQLKQIVEQNFNDYLYTEEIRTTYLKHPLIIEEISKIRQIIRERLKKISHIERRRELKGELLKRYNINDATNIN